MEKIIMFLTNLFPNDYLLITVASAFPLIELKGSILLGISKGMPPLIVLILSYLGSSLIVPFILLFLRPILNLLKKIPLLNKIALAIEYRITGKAAKLAVNKASCGQNSKWNNLLLSLFIFVALPLPLTGVWTGAAIACFLDIDYFKAMLSIILGNITAGLIVFCVAMLFRPYADIIFAAFIVIVLAAIILSASVSIIKNIRRKRAERIVA
ncbi:MAG: hypothetical protein EOM87_03905 [Clostridia bacterium]|nr:hypothetical protein [Clostridia bacterium]